jgi:hypothetical protein
LLSFFYDLVQSAHVSNSKQAPEISHLSFSIAPASSSNRFDGLTKQFEEEDSDEEDGFHFVLRSSAPGPHFSFR